jgi:hypothetical protein
MLLEVLPSQIRATGQFAGKLDVAKGGQNVWDNRLFIDIHAENSAVPIDPDDTVGGLVLRGDEDISPRYTGHVYARPRFQVI